MIKNRSGIEPRKEKYLMYEITTLDVKRYIQNKFNAIVKRLNEKGEKIKPIKIQLVSTKIGEKSIPFSLILPITVDSEYTNYREMLVEDDENVNPIFLQDYDDDDDDDMTFEAVLLDWVSNLIKPFTYNSEDLKYFSSRKFRSDEGVTRKNANHMVKFVDPRIINIEGRHGEITERRIMVMLDPIRVFYDMLKDVNTNGRNNDYQIFIMSKESKEIKSGLFRYTIKREMVKPSSKKEYQPDMVDTVQSVLTGEPVKDIQERRKRKNKERHHNKNYNDYRSNNQNNFRGYSRRNRERNRRIPY